MACKRDLLCDGIQLPVCASLQPTYGTHFPVTYLSFLTNIYWMELNKIYQGDALEVLKTFPDNSIDCCVTSPPYFQLRSYLPDDHPDKEKEIGSHGSPEEYVDAITTIFREVRRVLKPTGVCYTNLGDSYASNGIYIGKYKENHPEHTDLHIEQSQRYPQKQKGFRGRRFNIKKKDLMMIPHRVAISLCDDGWYIRSDIIYAKQNCMPSSVVDRPVSSKEYVFMITKSPNYYWDWEAIATEPSPSYAHDKRAPRILRNKFYDGSKYTQDDCDPKIAGQFKKQDGVNRSDYIGPNARYKQVEKVRRRDVWRMTVPGSKIKHFAMMNPKLVELCILSGCPEGGIVLDPFGGAGTVGMVARDTGRQYILIELNPEYVETAHRYLEQYKWDTEQKKIVSSI